MTLEMEGCHLFVLICPLGKREREREREREKERERETEGTCV